MFEVKGGQDEEKIHAVGLPLLTSRDFINRIGRFLNKALSPVQYFVLFN